MTMYTKEMGMEALNRQVAQLLRLAFGSDALLLLEEDAWTELSWTDMKARYPKVIALNTCNMIDLEESLLLFQEKFHKLNTI